jgi:hypothetical protein
MMIGYVRAKIKWPTYNQKGPEPNFKKYASGRCFQFESPHFQNYDLIVRAIGRTAQGLDCLA